MSQPNRLLALVVPTILFVSSVVLFTSSSFANSFPDRMRNYDARPAANVGFKVVQSQTQKTALTELFESRSDLVITFDPSTGATRTLYHPTSYLTESSSGDAEAIALSYLQANRTVLGLVAEDLVDLELTDRVFSAVTGATHLYYRQTHAGLPLYNGQLQIHVNRDGRVLSINSLFLPALGQAAGSTEPQLSAAEAVGLIADELGHAGPAARVHHTEPGIARRTTLSHDLSKTGIEAELMWLSIRTGVARLVWNFQLDLPEGNHVWDFTVDAESGATWTRFDWVDSADYRVFPMPIESPNHASTPPPADGRTLLTDPHDVTASPFGWHDTNGAAGPEFTIHRGNNVHSYDDSNGSNSPPAVEPDCGAGLACDFDFPIDFATQEPPTYIDASVTSLFYWSNIIHDVQYRYGFDEAAGNFQVNNYGNGGSGNDAVQAQTQDTGDCNANFATPPDGSQPTMQMYPCSNSNPAHDGSFDAGVVLHEYGHGISNRLVGGPSNTSCLNNDQQPGEGLSDWWSLIHTIETGDAGTDKRGVGTYLLGQPTTGNGIRSQPYSTDPAINTHTYSSINGMAVPHGVGEVWAQGYWEATWALIGEHGFDTDFYTGTGGNNRANLYIVEGLKNSICSPAFTDVRDGILQAATDNFGGEDVCTLWEAFAAFGLGSDAVSGGPNSTSPTDGFDYPAQCQCDPGQTIPIADAGNDQTICSGAGVTIGTAALPGHTYSWSPGGQTTPQVTVNPTETTEYTVTVTTDCGQRSDSITVAVDTGVAGISEDFESGIGSWSLDGLWHLAADSTCAAPEPGYSSPLTSAYYGQDGVCTYDTGARTTGELCSPILFGIDGTSTLEFDFLRQVEDFVGNYDITRAEVVQGGARTTVWSLNATNPSAATWTNSGSIDLSAFAGNPIELCFVFDTVDGTDNDQIGLFIDDIEITGNSMCSAASPIFSDGFESGDVTAWDSSSP